jgi:hypothetical protein
MVRMMRVTSAPTADNDRMQTAFQSMAAALQDSNNGGIDK